MKKSFFVSVVLLAASALFAAPTFAAPISVSDQQAITTAGQAFNFSFGGLPTSGTGGQFSITLNGDYSGFASETSVASVDVAGGSLDLGNQNNANGIVSNSVSGLTLDSYSITTFSFNDVEQSWVFNISDALLALMLGDGTLTASVQNQRDVNPFNEANADFVRVGYSYQSGVTVPEPHTAMILGLGLAGLAYSRRGLGPAFLLPADMARPPARIESRRIRASLRGHPGRAAARTR